MKKHASQLKYERRVRNFNYPMQCKWCSESLLPKFFNKHIKRYHTNLKNVCCWCPLNNPISWKLGEKHLHIYHLQKCFDRCCERVLMENGITSTSVKNKTIQKNHDEASLNQYRIRLYDAGKPIPCPRCGKLLLARNIESHVKDYHYSNKTDIMTDPLCSCVWCNGAVTWPKGHKQKNARHLKECFEKYYHEQPEPFPDFKQALLTEAVQDRKNKSILDAITATHTKIQKVTPDECRRRRRLKRAEQRRVEILEVKVRNLYGRIRVSSCKLDRSGAYDSVFETIHFEKFPELGPADWTITFEDASLQLAHKYVDLFVRWEKTADQVHWHHLMISAYAWNAFEDAIRTFGEERVFVLPFWCWCDGGRYEQNVFKHHRHLILAVRYYPEIHNKFYPTKRMIDQGDRLVFDLDNPKLPPLHNFMDYYWKNIPFSSSGDWPIEVVKPFHFHCMRQKRLQSVLHLINTIHYVSGRKSACNYEFKKNGEEADMEDEVTSRHHYYIANKCHPQSKLSLGLIAGPEALGKFFDNQNLARTRIQNCVKLQVRGGGWFAPVKELADMFGVVVPVKKEWRPLRVAESGEDCEVFLSIARNFCEKVGYFHLMDGKRLLFRWDTSLRNLSKEEWWAVQRKAGNVFYDVVEECFRPLNRNQAIIANVEEEVIKECNERWAPIVEEWMRKYQALECENESIKCEKDTLRIEKELLKSKNESLKRQLSVLKGEIVLENKRGKVEDVNNGNRGDGG